MKNFTYLLFAVFFLAACSSGKKALDRGSYDESVYKAVNRLRASPGSSKAAKTLREAYPLAQKWHLDRVNNYSQSADIYRWEKMVEEYAMLNRLYEEINRCPACLKVVGSPPNYGPQYDAAALKAAETRYALGEKAMENKLDRHTAKEAYFHYLKAQQLKPGFKDVAAKMKEAKYYATLKVVVQPIPMHSRNLKLSNEFFQNKINEFMRAMPSSEFVQFFTPEEAKTYNVADPSHVIVLEFDDFVVGQVYVKEREIQVSKDSVIVGNVNINDSTKKNVYNTVKATVHIFRKEISSGGRLDFKILDGRSKAVLTQEKFPGSYVWFTEWGYFNGDERALDPQYKKIIGTKEAPPPMPQDLFVAFTLPIYDQLTAKIRQFYQGY